MKNSYFSGAGFFTGAGIEPETFRLRVRRATIEPPWLFASFPFSGTHIPEKLRFEKTAKSILTSNISEIHKRILLSQEPT